MDLNAYLAEVSHLNATNGNHLRDGWMKVMKETLKTVQNRVEWIAKITIILETEGLDLSRVYQGKKQVYACYDRFSFSDERLTQAIQTEQVYGKDEIKLTDMSSKAEVVLDGKGRVQIETVEDYFSEKGLIYTGYARLHKGIDIYFFNVYNHLYPNLLSDGEPRKTGLTCRKCGQDITLENECVSYEFRCNPCDATRWKEECIGTSDKEIIVETATGETRYRITVPSDVDYNLLSKRFGIVNNKYRQELGSLLYAIRKATKSPFISITDCNGGGEEDLNFYGAKFSECAEFASGRAALRSEEDENILLEVWDSMLPPSHKNKDYAAMRLKDIQAGAYYMVSKLGLNGKRTFEFPDERIIVESLDASLMEEVYEIINDDESLKQSSSELKRALDHIGAEWASVPLSDVGVSKFAVLPDKRDNVEFKVGSFVVYNNGVDYHPAVIRGSFVDGGKLSYLLFVCSEAGSEYQATTSGSNLFSTMEESFIHFKEAKKLEFEKLNNHVVECQVKVMGGAKC